MTAEHRKPMLALVAVLALCALIVGNSMENPPRRVYVSTPSPSQTQSVPFVLGAVIGGGLPPGAVPQSAVVETAAGTATFGSATFASYTSARPTIRSVSAGAPRPSPVRARQSAASPRAAVQVRHAKNQVEPGTGQTNGVVSGRQTVGTFEYQGAKSKARQQAKVPGHSKSAQPHGATRRH